jgi:hypothetical protein
MVWAFIRRKIDLKERRGRRERPDSDDSCVKKVDKVDDEIVEEYDMKWFKKRNKCKRKEASEQRGEVDGDNFFFLKGLCF